MSVNERRGTPPVLLLPNVMAFKAPFGSKNHQALLCAGLAPAPVSDLNAVVWLLALTTQHVNITFSSVALSYSRPPQTQAIMLFTLCQALPQTMTLFLLEVT